MMNPNQKQRTQPITAAEIYELTYGDFEIDDETWGKDVDIDSTSVKGNPAKEHTTNDKIPISKTEKNEIGKVYSGYLKSGTPIAVIRDSFIYKGFIPGNSQPISNLTNGQVFPGFVRGGNPVATITEKHICPGLLKHSNYLGIVIDGHVYHYFMRGNPIVSYSGSNEEEALAAAFLLGLFDQKK